MNTLEIFTTAKNLILSADMQDVVNEALNPSQINFFGLQVTEGFITGLIVTFTILLFALILRVFFIPRFEKTKTPGKLQMFLEYIVTYFDKSSTTSVHKYASFLGPYMFTTAMFIALTTLSELLGMRPTFSTINACIAFGVTTFFVIQISGLNEFGVIKRGKRALNPINLITDVSVPLSLSLRLFGAVTSGVIITEIMYTSLVTSIVLPAVIAIVTTLFHAFIQAYIFTTLTNVFVAEAVNEESKI